MIVAAARERTGHMSELRFAAPYIGTNVTQ